MVLFRAAALVKSERGPSLQNASGVPQARLGHDQLAAWSGSPTGLRGADCGLLSRDLAAGILHAKGVKNFGVRLGNWLTAEQSTALGKLPATIDYEASAIVRCWQFCLRAVCVGTSGVT